MKTSNIESTQRCESSMNHQTNNYPASPLKEKKSKTKFKSKVSNYQKYIKNV